MVLVVLESNVVETEGKLIEPKGIPHDSKAVTVTTLEANTVSGVPYASTQHAYCLAPAS